MLQSENGADAQLMTLFDPARGSLQVPVRLPDTDLRILPNLMSFARRGNARPGRGRLRIARAPDTVRRDAVVHLRASAVPHGGGTAAPADIAWRSLDSAVAEITRDSGVVQPRRDGAVRIEASAIGWLPDTVTLTIGAPLFGAPLLEERWNAPLDTTRWVPFGDPAARVVTVGAEPPALLLDGDGHLSSGLVQRSPVDARAGLGLEFEIIAPVNAAQWQTLTVGLTAVEPERFPRMPGSASQSGARGQGVPMVREWSQMDAASTLRQCHFTAPLGEGGVAREKVEFHAGGHSERIKRLPFSVTDGRLHTVRLQLFADGRCGLAVDGRVITISQRTLPLDRPLRTFLQGQSVGTSMRVGTISIWQGQRLDVPWFGGAGSTTSR